MEKVPKSEILVVNSKIRQIFYLHEFITDEKILNDLTRLHNAKFGFKTEKGETFAISPASILKRAGLLRVTDSGITDEGPAQFIMPATRPLTELERKIIAANN